VRGVKDVAIIDPALLGSADARRLDEYAASLQDVYARPHLLRRKGEETPIYGLVGLFGVVTAPAARASRSSATRAWAR
jgi:DNA gyrase subunit B